jgi:hypothetical protein
MSIQNIAYLLLLSKYFIEIPYTHLSFPESNIKGRLPHDYSGRSAHALKRVQRMGIAA